MSSNELKSVLAIILSLTLLFVAGASMFIYIVAVIAASDASSDDFAGMYEAAMISLFCVTPLAIASIVAFVAQLRYARYVLLLALVASLVSIGLFASWVLIRL